MMDYDVPGTVSKGALMTGAVWTDQTTLCLLAADSEEFESALSPCRQDNQSTRGLINDGICLSSVAVRWRNGLPSASYPGFDPLARQLYLYVSSYQLTRDLLEQDKGCW
jgi:hypothetical protein